MKKIKFSGNYPANKQTLKASVLIMSLIMVCSFSNAQIKVDASGKIGLKSSSTSANYDIFLNGSTNIYGSPFTLTNGYGNYLNISSNYASVII